MEPIFDLSRKESLMADPCYVTPGDPSIKPHFLNVSARPHLEEGWIQLLDSFRRPVLAWHDPLYAAAIRRGECTAQRWIQMCLELAVAQLRIVKTPFGWQRTGRGWTDELPGSW
jgi:hypothetical protein